MYIVVAQTIGSPYVGPAAATIAQAANYWYLQVCAAQAWGNEGDNFACDEHEEACRVKNDLAASSLDAPINSSILDEVLSVAKVDVNPVEMLRELHNMNHAAIIWTPEELGDHSISRLEDAVIEYGNNILEYSP